MFLDLLKKEANKTYTFNGAVTNRSTLSHCLDLFATAGALRNASDDEIIKRFMRAYVEDKDIAMKTLFFAREIRGGLGERRVFKVILKYLADEHPDSVKKNIDNIAEYGRYDDLLVLIGTRCEKDVFEYIEKTLKNDMSAMKNNEKVSLMAKWLPSVNASNRDTVMLAKRIARSMDMNEADYRKMLSALRAYIRIIENNLREMDYSFDYEKQPSKALYKYRKAFIRNDEERYKNFITAASSDPTILHTGTLAPYEIVSPILKGKAISSVERKVLDTTWNALENYVDSDNSLVVVDGSGSMYWGRNPSPAEVAQSLGIYFAEHNKGMFHNHFITFSANPKLVEIKGEDIYDKVKYCMSFNDCSNTDIKKTFDLILNTAVMNRMKQSDMPKRLIIISDMEFDCCANNSSMTNFEYAKASFEAHGYKLPQLVFWNVNSMNEQLPVTKNEQGVVLVSGASASVFEMMKDGNIDPYKFMMSVISTERYERIAA